MKTTKQLLKLLQEINQKLFLKSDFSVIESENGFYLFIDHEKIHILKSQLSYFTKNELKTYIIEYLGY